MRKLFFLGLSLFAICTLRAGVITVSNDPARPAQHTDPNTALAAATPGDTLYIYGSPNTYPDFTINKSITVIGAGFNTRKEVFYKTNFTWVYIGAGSVSNVTIDGIICQILRPLGSGGISYSNVTIRNTLVYQSFGLGNVSCGLQLNNWLIENCFIQTYVTDGNTGCNPIAPVTNGFLVKNSIIVNPNGFNYNQTFINCQFGTESGSNSFSSINSCTFTNCIFYKMYFAQNSTNTNNQFTNCLTYLTSFPDPNFNLQNWTGGATGTASGCIINQNPLWVTIPDAAFFYATPLATPNVWNPVLQAGSPADNAGTDGSDIGLTGGTVPYNYFAEPKIPVVRRYQLVNAVVPPSGTVTANATATKAQ